MSMSKLLTLWFDIVTNFILESGTTVIYIKPQEPQTILPHNSVGPKPTAIPELKGARELYTGGHYIMLLSLPSNLLSIKYLKMFCHKSWYLPKQLNL